MNNNNRSSVVAAGLVLLMLGGCSTLEYLPIDRSRPEELQSRLEVGETVVLRLHSGDHRQMRILALESDAMVGRDERIAYRDIDRLEVKRADYEGTAKTAVALTALAAVFVAGALLEAELNEERAMRCESTLTGGAICTED
jgi:hypothetical protein